MTPISHRAILLALALASGILPATTKAQPPSASVQFDIISVKPSKSNDLPFYSNFSLSPGDAYVPNGGHFSAANWPLATYIAFAYEISGTQQGSLLSQLPTWATTDHYDIQAQTDGSPAKDTKPQMRLMMRSLLADRFHVALHFETRQDSSVLALIPLKPGKTGPLLQPYLDDPPCSAASPSQPNPANRFPPTCGALAQMRPTTPGLVRFGARNVTLPFIAAMLTSMGSFDRPVLDQTGLDGNFDFALEWVYQAGTADVGADQPSPLFMDAVREQLGLKLESQKAPVEVLVIDHVEKPSEN